MLAGLMDILSIQATVHKLGEAEVIIKKPNFVMNEQKLTALDLQNLTESNKTENVKLEFDFNNTSLNLTNSNYVQVYRYYPIYDFD